MTCLYGEPGGLTQAPIPAVIYLAEGRGASIVAVSTSGDWPVGTALEWHTDPVLSMPAIIDGTTARWDLTASQVAQVYDSRQARVVVDGGLPRIVAAVLVDYAWTAGGGQALGQVIVGPQGVSVESATVVSGRLMLTMSSGEVIDAGPVSGAGSLSWLDLTDLPTAFPPTAHNHDDRYYTEAEVTTALAGKEATGVAASLLSAHTGATDPHPQYTTPSEAAAAAPVQSVAGKTGDVTLAVEDVSGAVASTDGRLSDPRTPLAHKATHQSGGADALTPADIGAATSAQGAKADAALPAVSYTAADVLAKVTTVDGAGSGLDADTLDGQHASAFATASHSHTLDQTTDTATRVAMTPAERTKLAAQSGTNTGDQTLPVWSTLAGKPPVIAAGADAAAARTAIGAGTSSLVIGTTAGTAADGKALADETTRATAAEATKAAASRQVIAGTGLTGGGDLTADRTLSVSYGTTAGTAAQGNDSRITGAAQKASNLSDLASTATARTNLGLGTAAVANTGTGAADVILGNDARLSDARTPLAHTHTATGISDSTTVGRAVLTAADAAAARTAIGAGTSSFSGDYADLSGKPTLGTAADNAETDFATAAQGSTADSAVQPGDDAADLGSGAAADGYVLTADGLGGAAWEAVPAGGAPALDDLSDVATAGAATGEALVYTGTGWAPTAAAVILEGDDRLTDARTPTSHNHAASAVTNFVETTQDIIGAMVAAAGGTYDDAAGTIALPSGGGLGSTGAVSVRNVAGRWYTGWDSFLTAGKAVPPNLAAFPISFPSDVTVDRIGIHITGTVAASVVRLGIYASLGSGLPGALVVDAGTIDSSVAGLQQIVLSQALSGGATYWLVTTASAGVTANGEGTPYGSGSNLGAVDLSTAAPATMLYVAGNWNSAALPASFPTSGLVYGTGYGRPGVRIGAVS